MRISTTNIVLIGMPGCGKSSIGEMIGQILQTDFYDLDAYIEEKAHRSISELFQLGEDHFRQLESSAVREIYQKEAIVISTGGGIVIRPENMRLLKKTGTIFYIERPLDMILESSDLTNRPLLAEDRTKIYTLHKQRKHLYEEYCHFRIINNQSLAMAVEQISKIMLKWMHCHAHHLRKLTYIVRYKQEKDTITSETKRLEGIRDIAQSLYNSNNRLILCTSA